MGQYFKRLAHRTGMLETRSLTRQTTPVAALNEVVEISQQVAVPAHTPEHAPRDRQNMGRVPTKTGGIQGDAVGQRHPGDHTDPEQTAISTVLPYSQSPPHIDQPVQYSFKNNVEEKQSSRYTDHEPERPGSKYTESVQQASDDQVVEHVLISNSDDLSTTGQVLDKPFISDFATDLSTGSGLGDRSTLLRPELLLSEPERQKNFGAPREGKINELNTSIVSQAVQQDASTTESLSIPSISAVLPVHNDRVMPAGNVPDLTYSLPLSIPDKAPAVTSNQNIEIRIGSITMEVHQQQPAKLTSILRTKATDGGRSRSSAPSSGFRPSRYYFRGL